MEDGIDIDAIFAEMSANLKASEQVREHSPLWTRVQAHHIPAQLAASTFMVGTVLLLAGFYTRYKKSFFWPSLASVWDTRAGTIALNIPKLRRIVDLVETMANIEGFEAEVADVRGEAFYLSSNQASMLVGKSSVFFTLLVS